MQDEQLVEKLKSKRRFKRLNALKTLAKTEEYAEDYGMDVNINVVCRTTFSCFDTTPALAAYRLAKNGMPIIGVVDYASLSAAKEIYKAEKILKKPYYTGAETECIGSDGIVRKMLSVGVPHKNAKPFDLELYFYRKLRNEFASSLIDGLNSRFKKYDIHLAAPKTSFYRAMSTEDIFIRLAESIRNKFEDGKAVIDFVSDELKIELSDKEYKRLIDLSNVFYIADLAKVLFTKYKMKFPVRKYKKVSEFVASSDYYGGISAVMLSDNLLDTIKFAIDNHIKGIFFYLDKLENYNCAPEEIYDACVASGLLPIGLIVADYPKKNLEFKFDSEETSQKYKDVALSIVGNEIASSINLGDGMFSDRTIENTPIFTERIRLFSRIGSKGSVK